MTKRTIDGSSVVTGLFLKDKTGGFRPARRLTFVHAATKVSKNAFLLAEGISFAGFLRHPITSELHKPARYRGASLTVWLTGEKHENMTTVATLHERRGSQEPRILRGKCRVLVGLSSLS